VIRIAVANDCSRLTIEVRLQNAERPKLLHLRPSQKRRE
jgi:hypothetical protein